MWKVQAQNSLEPPNTGIKSEPAFNESRFAITFSIILGFTDIYAVSD